MLPTRVEIIRDEIGSLKGLRPMLPNFLVIGAPKAGTTSLWDFLRAHPQVYMPADVKETNYFVLEGKRASYRGPGDEEGLNRVAVTDRARYERLFDGVTDEMAVGEVSPFYMSDADIPRRISACIPRAKMVAILRNPVDRAFSSYLHLVRDGRETLDFATALQREAERAAANWEPLWRYRDLGLYHKYLSRYYELFDPGQIRVYLFEELIGDKRETLANLMQFLGIDNSVEIELKKMNSAAHVTLAKNRLIKDLVFEDNIVKQAAKRWLPAGSVRMARDLLVSVNSYKPRIAASVRRELQAFYRRDIEALERLIDRDLSRWLTA